VGGPYRGGVAVSDTASESIRKLGVRGARALGRIVALGIALGFFVGLPVFAIVEGRWVALVLWAVLITLMWIGNAAAPRQI